MKPPGFIILKSIFSEKVFWPWQSPGKLSKPHPENNRSSISNLIKRAFRSPLPKKSTKMQFRFSGHFSHFSILFSDKIALCPILVFQFKNHLRLLNTVLLRFYFILSFVFLFSESYSQSDRHYLYVEIRGLSNQRGVPELRQELTATGVVDSVTYCENAGLAILHTVPPADSARTKINLLLHKLNYKYILKSEIPIEEARKLCGKFSHR